jgi:transposase
MKMEVKYSSKTVMELEKTILLLQQEIEKQKQEIISYKERYIRLLEEFKLEKLRLYAPSSEKNLQPGLFDEVGIVLDNELVDQLDDAIDIQAYKRKKHPVRKCIPSDIPREVITHDIPESEKICNCGAELICIPEFQSIFIHYN